MDHDTSNEHDYLHGDRGETLQKSIGNIYEDQIFTHLAVLHNFVPDPLPTFFQESVHAVFVDGAGQLMLIRDLSDRVRILSKPCEPCKMGWGVSFIKVF